MHHHDLDTIVAGIADNYKNEEILFCDPNRHFPNKA